MQLSDFYTHVFPLWTISQLYWCVSAGRGRKTKLTPVFHFPPKSGLNANRTHDLHISVAKGHTSAQVWHSFSMKEDRKAGNRLQPLIPAIFARIYTVEYCYHGPSKLEIKTSKVYNCRSWNVRLISVLDCHGINKFWAYLYFMANIAKRIISID